MALALGDELGERRDSSSAAAAASGWSGASATNFAPNSVSPRVVKISSSLARRSAWSCPDRARSATSKPSERPIQLLLHQPHLLRPALERVERVEQLLRVVGDLEEPLRQLALLDQRARAPAAAVDHLLVGEHGLVDRVPVDLRLLALDQARLAGSRGTSSAGACSSPDRRSRSRAPSRATAPSTSAAASSPRCSGRSRRADAPCARSRRSPPACRRRPSPSDAARRSRARACSARPRRPWCSCARGPCGCAPTDRGTSRARSISARGSSFARRRRCRARPISSASAARPRGRCSGRCWRSWAIVLLHVFQLHPAPRAQRSARSRSGEGSAGRSIVVARGQFSVPIGRRHYVNSIGEDRNVDYRLLLPVDRQTKMRECSVT